MKRKKRLALTLFDPECDELPPGRIPFECAHGHNGYGAIPSGYRLEDVTPDRYEFVLPPHKH